MLNRSLKLAAAAVLAQACTLAAAQTTTFANGDFEAHTALSFDSLATNVPNWLRVQGTPSLVTDNGNEYALLHTENWSTDLSPDRGYIRQVFSVSDKSATYRVSFQYWGSGSINFYDDAASTAFASQSFASGGTSFATGYLDFKITDPSHMSSFVRLNVLSNAGLPGSSFAVDNFSISAVPEPQTYAMMLAGLALVGRLARKQRSKA